MLKKACEIFSEIKEPIQDLYLSKFNIYCLINNNKRDEAQLLIDLQLELGIADKFFNKKIDYLMGYNTEPANRSFRKNNFRFSFISQNKSRI